MAARRTPVDGALCVREQNNRAIPLAHPRTKVIGEARGDVAVEAREWFIQDKQLRRGEQRARQADAPQLAS